jgi:threonine dehydratase
MAKWARGFSSAGRASEVDAKVVMAVRTSSAEVGETMQRGLRVEFCREK